jgi:hypothetical protein
MHEQNLKNHGRYIPFWHFITPLLLAALLVATIINLTRAEAHLQFNAAIPVLIAVILCIFYWYTRWFALRAQDRAIRAEENLRYYSLTGQLLDKRLRMGQIIALRFASDGEFVALAKRAVDEKLSPGQIKQAIHHWKGDYYRV